MRLFSIYVSILFLSVIVGMYSDSFSPSPSLFSDDFDLLSTEKIAGSLWGWETDPGC